MNFYRGNDSEGSFFHAGFFIYPSLRTALQMGGANAVLRGSACYLNF